MEEVLFADAAVASGLITFDHLLPKERTTLESHVVENQQASTNTGRCLIMFYVHDCYVTCFYVTFSLCNVFFM